MEGFVFATDVRVRFAETDAQGIAHHSNFLVWFELTRVAYLQEFAGGYNQLRAQGLEATVVEAHVRYRIPARFDDVIRIWARCSGVRGARFRYDYELERLGDGALIADGWTTHACVDATTLRPRRLPTWLIEAIATAEAQAAPAQSSSPSS